MGAAPLTLRERHVSQPLGCGGCPRLIELRLGEGERALEMTRAGGVLAQRETHVAQRVQRLHLRAAVLECFRDAERHLVPGPRLGVPAHLLLEPAGAQQGRDHARRVGTLLAFERLHLCLEERLQVLRDAVKRLRHPPPQLVRVDAPLPKREIRTRARPNGGVVRPGDSDQQRAQGLERLELRHQCERFLDPNGRGPGHSPYSFIFRVSVLRWIPRISAAAPICPFVWAITLPICRASPSASVSRPHWVRSASVASSPRSSSGRCSARSVWSVATMTARSITLRSSRTLPTQAWARSSSSARSEMA